MQRQRLAHEAVGGAECEALELPGVCLIGRRVPAQVEFMRRQRLAYEAVGGAEYEALKPELVRVQEAQGNFAFAAEIKLPASRDAFFKARSRYPKTPNPARTPPHAGGAGQLRLRGRDQAASLAGRLLQGALALP